MVPMAGQDAIFYRASVQWETHVRTAIVNGINFVVLAE
jgi:hypothetical protein